MQHDAETDILHSLFILSPVGIVDNMNIQL